jgi:site-specific recombinase XerD
LIGRLQWYLDHFGCSECGKAELRRFFAYLSSGHLDACGRWGNTLYSKPLRPVTIATYFRHFKAFFNWLASEEFIEESPMDRLAPPVVRIDQVQPFTHQQIEALLQAARKSKSSSSAWHSAFKRLRCSALSCF